MSFRVPSDITDGGVALALVGFGYNLIQDFFTADRSTFLVPSLEVSYDCEVRDDA